MGALKYVMVFQVGHLPKGEDQSVHTPGPRRHQTSGCLGALEVHLNTTVCIVRGDNISRIKGVVSKRWIGFPFILQSTGAIYKHDYVWHCIYARPTSFHCSQRN